MHTAYCKQRCFSVWLTSDVILAKCYTEGFKCSTDPQSYFGAEPDLSWNDYYDAFDSDDDVDALHMPAEFEDVAADGDSDLH